MATEKQLLNHEGMIIARPGFERTHHALERRLSEEIIGQPEAIAWVMRALRGRRLRDQNRPVGVFLFLGPTGVGKTETAQVLAQELRPKDPKLLKIDCSLFKEGHEVSALIGAPPSYVGREQKPLFDPEITEKPNNVILFDEIEKGSESLWDLLLQIFETGSIKMLNGGHTVSFTESTIILTSNVGAAEMVQATKPPIGFHAATAMHEEPSLAVMQKIAMGALARKFKPEFLNRIDQQIAFRHLGDLDLEKIIERFVRQANIHYEEQAGIALQIDSALTADLVRQTPDRRSNGARAVRRTYETQIQTPLAELVDSGGIPIGSNVRAVRTKDIPGLPQIPGQDITFLYLHDRFLQAAYEDYRNIKLQEELLQSYRDDGSQTPHPAKAITPKK